MNNEKKPTSKRSNIIDARIRDAYLDRILGLFGFELYDIDSYDTCCKVYWRHLERGWMLSVTYDDGGVCIRNGGATEIPTDADFARHLATEGLYEWKDGDLKVNEERSLEEILQVVLHYLPDQEVMSILRSAIAWERDCADSEMAQAQFDAHMLGTKPPY